MTEPTHIALSHDELTRTLREAMAGAIRDTLNDRELVGEFWKKGFDELSGHTANGASQWLGRRILTWLIAAMTTAGLIWLVKSGAIK